MIVEMQPSIGLVEALKYMYVCCLLTFSYASEPFKVQGKNIYIDSATYQSSNKGTVERQYEHPTSRPSHTRETSDRR